MTSEFDVRVCYIHGSCLHHYLVLHRREKEVPVLKLQRKQVNAFTYLRISPDYKSLRVRLIIYFIRSSKMLHRHWCILTGTNQTIFCHVAKLNYSRYTIFLTTIPLFTEAFPIIPRNNGQPVCLE